MGAAITAPSLARKVREYQPLVMVTAYDAPGARIADEAGVDMILVGDSLAMVVLGYEDTLQVTVEDMAHHTAAVARAEPRAADRRRPAVAELPRARRGHGAQRGHADPRRRAGGEARGRRQAPPDDRGDRRRRDPGDGPPRPHAAVGPRHGRLQGAGQAGRRRARRWSTTRLPSPTPVASRSCSRACPTRWPRWSPTRSPCPRSASAPALRATARCWCSTTCSASRTGSARSSSAATHRSRTTRSTAMSAYAADVRARRFPSDGESYHLSEEASRCLVSTAAEVLARRREAHSRRARYRGRRSIPVVAHRRNARRRLLRVPRRRRQRTRRTRSCGDAREGVGGFDTVGFSIEHGAVTDEWCALLAGNDKQRQTGMMGRTDLGGLDAMVFAFPSPVDFRRIYFYNRRVPIALSVAWFDPDGEYLSATDMEPCADVPDCPRFTTTRALQVRHRGSERRPRTPGHRPRLRRQGRPIRLLNRDAANLTLRGVTPGRHTAPGGEHAERRLH